MLLTRRFGGVVEKFIGDGVMAVFNRAGDQPDHARLAACAALALQRAFGELTEQHPDWPRMRVGVNSGDAVVREIGGEGHLAYPLVGDTINTGSRLEALTKETPYMLHVAESTYDLLKPEAAAKLTYIDEVPIRGRTTKLKLWGMGLSPVPAVPLTSLRAARDEDAVLG